jgi:hypothetical protein
MFPIQSSSLCLPPLNSADEPERAIVSTLLYYDLFAYPLRADELVRFVHRDEAAPRRSLGVSRIVPLAAPSPLTSISRSSPEFRSRLVMS